MKDFSHQENETSNFLKRKRDFACGSTSTEAIAESSKEVEAEAEADIGLQPSLSVSHMQSQAPNASPEDGFPGDILETNSDEDEEDGKQEAKTQDGLAPYGLLTLIGRRRKNNDAVIAVPKLVEFDNIGTYDFYAVYDGHGGERVEEACRKKLHELVVKAVDDMLENNNGRVDWWEVMEDCFVDMDREVCGRLGGGGFVELDDMVLVRSFGSSALVALVGKNEIVVANCGDSRAVLYRDEIAFPLSLDHKPDRPDEMERVEAAGGRIINSNGPRVLGILATSRSIGDKYLKPYVTSKPEVMVYQKSRRDDFLILASNGLWDVVSNESACKVVKKCFDEQTNSRPTREAGIYSCALESVHQEPNTIRNFSKTCATEAAAVLVELAMARGSKDNVSVIVVHLKEQPGA